MAGGGDAALVDSEYRDVTVNVETTASSNSTKEELRRFAEQFRLRRMRLGATQADVGAAMVNLRGTSTALSQSTVCRFETMTLSCGNMQSLRPALEAWLTAAENRRATELQGDDDPPGHAWWPATAGRRRRRTTISGPLRRSLEAQFAVESRPSSQRVAEIADKLRLKKSVVSVWYCNQRQKLKRLKSWNDTVASRN